MAMYYFADWKDTGQGFAPDLPPEKGFLLLAQPGKGEKYAIFKVRLTPDEAAEYPVEAVSRELDGLLDAAEQYAPALAIARDEVRDVVGATRAEFDVILASCLRELFASQHRSRFFLAMATGPSDSYKRAGDYYWIVGYRPGRVGREIAWVSREFFVYHDRLDDFDCSKGLLESRFPIVPIKRLKQDTND